MPLAVKIGIIVFAVVVYGAMAYGLFYGFRELYRWKKRKA